MISRCFRHIVYCYIHCFRFSGRDARQVFCDFYLCLCAVLLVLVGVGFVLMLKQQELLRTILAQGAVFIFGFMLWSILSLLSAATRRGHDLDMSFWKVWLGHRFVATFLYVYLCRQEGSSQNNRFGPAPKENIRNTGASAEFPDVWNG